jgi:hypothetical protein
MLFYFEPGPTWNAIVTHVTEARLTRFERQTNRLSFTPEYIRARYLITSAWLLSRYFAKLQHCSDPVLLNIPVAVSDSPFPTDTHRLRSENQPKKSYI